MAKKKSTDRRRRKEQDPALPEEVGSKVTAATASAPQRRRDRQRAELPFSEMISRWLDDGDRLHETGARRGR